MSQEHEDDLSEPAAVPRDGLAEAQIAAIEGAFAEHERMLTRLRRELEELRSRPGLEQPPRAREDVLAERLDVFESRLDQHDQALRHILQRLIALFEREAPGPPPGS